MYVLVCLLALTSIWTVDGAANTKICTDVMWGSFISGEPWDADGMNKTAYYDNAIQRSSQIVHWFTNWGDGSGEFGWNVPYHAAIAKNFTSVGNSLHHIMLTWQPWGSPFQKTTNTYSLADIAAGKHNTYIDTWVNGVKKLKSVVYIRFAHEMDGDWYPWGQNNGNTPPQYISAWRHIVTRFRDGNVTNAQFVWCPNNSNNNRTDQTLYFPGDAYVDWICLDAYAESTQYSFASTITTNCNPQNPYQRLTAISTKPMMIAEWGVKEPTAANQPTKAQWYTDAANAIVNQFPRIKAIVYFNQYGYVMDSSSASLNGARSAFGGCASIPSFSAGPTSVLPTGTGTSTTTSKTSTSTTRSGTQSPSTSTSGNGGSSDIGSTNAIQSQAGSSQSNEFSSFSIRLDAMLIISMILIAMTC